MQFWEGEVFKTSEFNNNFLKGFSQVTFPTTHLKISSKKSHPSSLPITSTDVPPFLAPRLVTLCLWLLIQRQRSRLCQDQELEFMCPWRSKEERRIDTTTEITTLSGSRTGIPVSLKNLSQSNFSSGPFPSDVRESIYWKRSIERSRRDWRLPGREDCCWYLRWSWHQPQKIKEERGFGEWSQ